jgi:hypothetical protein
VGIIEDITKMRQEAKQRHQEVLNMIEALSDAASSDTASTVINISLCLIHVLMVSQMTRVYSGSHNRYVVSNV